jgi:hypothetical protein
MMKYIPETRRAHWIRYFIENIYSSQKGHVTDKNLFLIC